MVMAASGSKSAAGATMKSAAQSNASSGPRGPTGPSNSQPRSSPAGNSGGSPGSVSRSNPSGSRNGGGNSGGSSGYAGGGASSTSRIGSAASAQRMSSAQASSATSSAPNAAAAKASAAYRTSGALNAGLGRDPSPISGALNTSRSIATPPSLPNTRQPAQVQNYLGSGTATPFGGYQYGPGQMYADPYRSRAALGSVLNNAKLAGMDPRQTSDAVLRSAGMTNPMARAGVLGTFDHESAGFNPTIYGDQGTAYGLAQWRGPRQAGLQRYSAGMGQPTGTVGVQTAYALTEMGRAFPKTLNSLQAAQDVQSAVSAMNAYEKPRGYVPGGDPTVVAGWADRLARSNAALASVTKDQSRIAPEQGTTTAFTKDQSRIMPEVAVNIANAARVPQSVIDNTRVVSPRHWGREEVNYLTQIGAYAPIMNDPYASVGYNRLQNPDGSGLRLQGDVPKNINGAYLNNSTPSIDGIRVSTELSPQKYGGTVFHELGHAGAFQTGEAVGDDETRQRLSDLDTFPPSHPQHKAAREYFNIDPAAPPKAPPARSNVVPSWRQSTYTGPTERILAVEDVPPLGTSAQGGLGVFGVSSPVASQRPLSVPSTSTTAQRNAFYGGGPTPPRAPSTYSGYGTFNGPSIVTTPDPNASLPNYAGFRQFAQPANPPIPRPRPAPQNYPVKPYGSGTAKAIDSVVNLTPGAGVVNMIGGLFGKSAGDIYTSEENKLANMTPEQRERYRSYWGDVRANAPGRGPENNGSERPAMSVPVSTARPSASTDTSQPSDTASANWQSDALAYGYSEAQLNDPEIRALIKELWDMGFIPKTSSA